jgi:AcrR family transcriptional regulator
MTARRARVLRDQQGGDHPQALRHHLIGVTQRLLALHGLTGLTTRGIAREAQVSDGVLYNHFAHKDELVVTALAERMAELSSQFSLACPRPGEQDLHTGLNALMQLCWDFQTQTFPLIGVLLSRPDLLHELLARVHVGDSAPQLLWQEVCDYLAGEQQRGTLSPDVDPHTVAEIVFSACQLHVLANLLSGRHGTMPPPGQPSKPPVERLVTFLLRACTPATPDDT